MENDFGQREPWVTMAHFAAAYSQLGILVALHAKDVNFLKEKPGVSSVIEIAAGCEIESYEPALNLLWLKKAGRRHVSQL